MFTPIHLGERLRAIALVAGAATWLGCDAQSISAPKLTVAAPTFAVSAKGGRAASGGTVYVSSQGLHYDTFVAQDPLPMEGRFQLIAGGVTEFGPGDPGYLGGRWWEDSNHNGMQDAGDHFFLCPLLPPGRPTP